MIPHSRLREISAETFTQRRRITMLLTKHENQTFQNQTIYLSGQAFIGCTFQQCTLILRETVYHIDRCTFERCNWHIDRVLMWGNEEAIKELRTLTTMMEQALAQHQQSQGGAADIPQITQPTT
jgi:hypothetical protein